MFQLDYIDFSVRRPNCTIKKKKNVVLWLQVSMGGGGS